MSYCAADADLTWQIWNKAAMVDVGTCDDRFCLFAEGLTTTKKPTTGTQSSTTSSQGRLIDTFFISSQFMVTINQSENYNQIKVNS